MGCRQLVMAVAALTLAVAAVHPAPASAEPEEGEPTAEELATTEVVAGLIEACASSSESLGDPTASVALARLRLATPIDDCQLRERCRRVDVAKRQPTLAHLGTAFRFWHWIHWCYRRRSVRVIATGVYVTAVNPTLVYRGVVSQYNDYYQWCCGAPNSGHVSFRQGRFENCLFRYGCVGNWYPWVRIRVHSDGTFTWRTGS